MSQANNIVKHISFPCDGLILQGYLHLPAKEESPVVIGSHGLYANSNSPKQIALAAECNRLGIAYFRFDHRGCGYSQGQFEAVTSLEARCRDLMAAAEVMSKRADIGDRLGLFGSSMGGTVCLSVAGRLNASALVTFAAPIRSQLTENKAEPAHHSKEQGIYFDATKRPFDITDRLAEIHNILIFHGDADDVVPFSHSAEIYESAKEPKKKIDQEQGDHPMSNLKHQQEFVRKASRWFKKYLV